MDGGDNTTREQAFALVYDHLRSLAGRMRASHAGDSLQPTALVHEAALRLLKAQSLRWESEAHFRAIAAQAMRQVLTDRARKARTERHGGGWRRVTLPDLTDQAHVLDVVHLDEVICELEAHDPRRAQVVVLRVFGDLEEREIAELMEVSTRTIRRDWRLARAWLMARLGTDLEA